MQSATLCVRGCSALGRASSLGDWEKSASPTAWARVSHAVQARCASNHASAWMGASPRCVAQSVPRLFRVPQLPSRQVCGQPGAQAIAQAQTLATLGRGAGDPVRAGVIPSTLPPFSQGVLMGAKERG